MSSPIASRFGLKSCLLLGAAIVPSIALAQQLCDTAETPPESYCAPVTRCSGGICVIEQPLCIAQLEVWPDGTADGSTCTASLRFRDIASAARCAGPGSFIFVHGVDAAGTPRPYTAPQDISGIAGGPGAWINIWAAGEVTLDGSRASLTQGNAFVTIRDVSYVSFKGFTIRGRDPSKPGRCDEDGFEENCGNCLNVFASDHVVVSDNDVGNCWNYVTTR